MRMQVPGFENLLLLGLPLQPHLFGLGLGHLFLPPSSLFLPFLLRLQLLLLLLLQLLEGRLGRDLAVRKKRPGDKNRQLKTLKG